jgi:hypothetical protein
MLTYPTVKAFGVFNSALTTVAGVIYDAGGRRELSVAALLTRQSKLQNRIKGFQRFQAQKCKINYCRINIWRGCIAKRCAIPNQWKCCNIPSGCYFTTSNSGKYRFLPDSYLHSATPKLSLETQENLQSTHNLRL